MADRAIDPAPYRFRPGARLADLPTDDVGPFESEDDAEAAVRDLVDTLPRLQHICHAHGTRGLLVVLQGMDAAGKDEAIVQVLGAMDPQQCEASHVHAPTGREGQHDYLWQIYRMLPGRGQVAVLNRSYYERVIGDRVHPDRLDEQSLPPEVQAGADGGTLWADRLRQIRDFERYLTENGIAVRKLLLPVSKEAQRERLIERTERPEKRWDVSMADATDRDRWDDFMAAYQDALDETSTDAAPWYVVPSDQRWFARAVVASVVADALASFHDGFPEPDDEQQERIESVRAALGA